MDKIKEFIKFAMHIEEHKMNLESIYSNSVFTISKNGELLDLLKELEDKAAEANVLSVCIYDEGVYTVQVKRSAFVKLTVGVNIVDSTLDNWTHYEAKVEGIHLVSVQKNASALEAPASILN